MFFQQGLSQRDEAHFAVLVAIAVHHPHMTVVTRNVLLHDEVIL